MPDDERVRAARGDRPGLLRELVLPRVAPQAGAERPYALLARALDKTGLTGIATLIMRDREYLAALRVREGVIVLERMHFADEGGRPTSTPRATSTSPAASSRPRSS